MPIELISQVQMDAAVKAAVEQRHARIGAGGAPQGALREGGGVDGVGCGPSIGPIDMRRDNGSVDWLIPKSPRLALARALGVDMVPFEFIITGNFSASGSPPVLTDQGPNKPISRDVLLYRIGVDIQVPSAFTADEFQPLWQALYCQTSGIQAAVNIYGAQRRRMNYAPLREVPFYCSSDEPWVITEDQIPSMDFNVTTPLPFAPLTITVTFTGKTPATDTTFRMSSVDAFNCLEKMGYCVATARALWGC